MARIRIPIREQLMLFIFFVSFFSLLSLSILTATQNYAIGKESRLANLETTVYGKASALAGYLQYFEETLDIIRERPPVKQAFERYSKGNSSQENWADAKTDLINAISTTPSVSGVIMMVLLPRVYSGNESREPLLKLGFPDFGGCLGKICAQVKHSYDHVTSHNQGYKDALFPTFSSLTSNGEDLVFNGTTKVDSNTTIVMGPWFAMSNATVMSFTKAVPGVSDGLIAGWATTLVDACFIGGLSKPGVELGETGELLFIGSARPGNKFPKPPDSMTRSELDQEQVRFLVMPDAGDRSGYNHRDVSVMNTQTNFAVGDFTAVREAFLRKPDAHKARSILSSKNEQSEKMSTAFVKVQYPSVDWVMVLEQTIKEVEGPMTKFQKRLMWEVAASLLIIIVISFPVAHFSVRPIRLLTEATEKTIQPDGQFPGGGSHGDAKLHGFSEKEGKRSKVYAGIMSCLRELPYQTRKPDRLSVEEGSDPESRFRIPGKVVDRKHYLHDELTDLTTKFNEMTDELVRQYEDLEDKVKERTRELEISKKAAETANDSKTLFLANLSHELKTPLNHILGLSALCMQEEDQAKIRRSLQIMYKSGDLLLHLLTDLLAFSKNEIGQQMNTNEQAFRVGDIGAQVVSLYEVQAKEGQIQLRATYHCQQDQIENGSWASVTETIEDPSSRGVRDMWLWGDQHRILQVLINLVGNSLKFTPRGGAVDVRIRYIGEADPTTDGRHGSTDTRHSRRYPKRRNSLSHYSPSPRRSPTPEASQVPTSAAIVPQNSRSSSSLPSRGFARINQATQTTYQGNFNRTNSQNGRRISRVTTVRERSESPPAARTNRLLFEFEVADTGPGIPRDQQEKVFEPFVQGELGLSKKFGGTGLGLSICAQLASLLGGTLSLRSQLGSGSIFTLQIPLGYIKRRSDSVYSSVIQLPSSSLPSSPSSPSRLSFNDESQIIANHVVVKQDVPLLVPPSPKTNAIQFSTPSYSESKSPASKHIAARKIVVTIKEHRGERVLVVDDNSVNQEVILRMLKLEDVSDISVANDGCEAVEKVRESLRDNQPFNLIFMDIQMPGLDGLESTRQIRSLGFSSPIVALSALSEESNMEKQCLDAGMNHFLPKPIRRPALKQVLQRFCAVPIEEGVDPKTISAPIS